MPPSRQEGNGFAEKFPRFWLTAENGGFGSLRYPGVLDSTALLPLFPAFSSKSGVRCQDVLGCQHEEPVHGQSRACPLGRAGPCTLIRVEEQVSALSHPSCSWPATASCSRGNGGSDRHLPPSCGALGKWRSPWTDPVSVYFCIGSMPRHVSFLQHRAVSWQGDFSAALAIRAGTV